MPFLSLVTWPLTLTFKLVRVRDQTRLLCEYGTNPFSGSEIFHAQTKKPQTVGAKKQNLPQFTVCGKETEGVRLTQVYQENIPQNGGTFGDKWHGFIQAWCPFCHPPTVSKHQRNSKLWPQPVALPHLLLIYHCLKEEALLPLHQLSDYQLSDTSTKNTQLQAQTHNSKWYGITTKTGRSENVANDYS